MASLLRGQRLIPAIIDDHAGSQPDRVYAAVPVDQDNLNRGYKDITYKHFARAVDAASHWLDDTLGKSNGNFETFIYLGARDLRYAIMALAAAKTGRVALFPSLFASMESHVFLAKKTKSQHILHSSDLGSLAREIQFELTEAPCIAIPGQEEWLNEHNDSIPPYTFTKTFEEAEWDPVIIVHTSGTTGLPKPVVYTHGHIAKMDTYFALEPIDGRVVNFRRATSGRFYNSLPVFHLAGFLATLIWPAFTDMVAVMGPTNKAPTPEIVEQVLDYSAASGAFFPPFLLEMLGREARTMAKLKKMKTIMFGGAPLATPVGEELNRTFGVDLINFIGNTEGGGWVNLATDPEDWQYFIFHPDLGFKFEKQDDDGIYELVVYRTPESEKLSSFWLTFPDETAYHTKDLFSPHPTKPDVWKYHCRLDDLILLTGEIKLYCRAIEEVIGDHPAVKGVLVGGDRRSHPFMLLEIQDDVAADHGKALDAIWETVEQENKRNAPSARIHRDLTIVTSPERPFVRSPKGSIERRKTFARYEQDINDLYGGPIGQDSMKRHDSASDVHEQRVPGTEELDRD